jgi:hypothetical protein
VLRSGMPALEYATHLLELAQRAGNARPDLRAVGIVSTSNLERRFVAMFDTGRSRTTVTSRARAITTSVALTMVCPLASLHVAPSAPLPAPHPPNAAPWHISAVPHPSVAAAPNSANAGTLMSDASHVSHAASVRAADVRPMSLQPPTPETEQPPMVAASDWMPSGLAIGHPNFSGKWKQDTVEGPTVDFHVTDSTIITQSANTISFDTRGHVLDAPTYSRFPNVSFDGTQSTGIAGTGSAGMNFAASAAWMADTLVVKTYAHAGAHDALTYERMTLNPDGTILLITNRSFADGKARWGGPQTFVLRRIAP